MRHDKQYLAIAKVMAPICLFVFTPFTAWMLYRVTVQAIASGKVIKTSVMIQNISAVIIMLGISIWMCRSTLGWFKSKK